MRRLNVLVGLCNPHRNYKIGIAALKLQAKTAFNFPFHYLKMVVTLICRGKLTKNILSHMQTNGFKASTKSQPNQLEFVQRDQRTLSLGCCSSICI